ncbi:hypothetical protein NHJ13051_009953, partial [Beauveria bassiana]
MAVADLENQFGALRMGEADYIPFNTPQHTQRWPPGRIPRYLFRVFTPKSQGMTNSSWAWSMDARHRTPSWATDIFARTDRAQAANMINSHLRWWTGADDNLVSWTSSLLFALVYVFHLRANIRDGSEFKDISLCMIDTKGIPDYVFIRDMDLIAAFRQESVSLLEFERLRCRQSRDFSGSYYFGEYLTQGALKIEGRCQIISSDLLIDAGLYHIREEFRSFADWEVRKKPPWAKPVVEMRQVFYSEKDQRRDMSSDGLEAAKAISRLLEPPWRLPMAASLVALAAPRTDDNAILVAFRSKDFTDDERQSCSLEENTFAAVGTLPEVNEYKDLMQSIYNDYYLNFMKEHLYNAEIALRSIRIFTLSDDFQNHEASQATQSFSLCD